MVERWHQFNVVRANASITGALWHLKGQPDVLKNVQVVAQLHRQHLVSGDQSAFPSVLVLPDVTHANPRAWRLSASFSPSTKGKRLLFPDVTPAQVSVAFIRACTSAGIEDFSMHDLRHTFASHARMNGVDLHMLQKRLGHSDPRMTDRYAHLSQTFLLDAARKLDGVPSLTPAAAENPSETVAAA
jgi:integrase